MTDSAVQAIVAILAADIALLIAYLAYISPKLDSVISERRKLLNKKLKVKINELGASEINIELLLPLFKEHETIQRWKNIFKQICVYLGYSIFLVIAGLFFCFLGFTVTLGNVPVEVLFGVGGGIYFLAGLYGIISHSIEVRKWKLSEKKISS